MSIKTESVDDLVQGYICTARDCHLCGEEFVVGMFDTNTICPKCKELWQTIIKERGKE